MYVPETRLSAKDKLGHNSVMLFRTLALLLVVTSVAASEGDAILAAVEQHARQLAAGHAGEIHIEAGPIDDSRLQACAQREAYSPPNTRNIGRTHIGIRCLAGANWNILVPVRIGVISTYVTTRRALLAGKTIQADDLSTVSGDLGALPTGTVIKPEQAVGKTLRNSIGAGQALRTHQLLAPRVIRQGQTVRVVSQGTGFAVRAEGKALNHAAAGELARVKMPSGRTISGIAQEDGSILLTN